MLKKHEMEKVDYKKQFSDFYSVRKNTISVVEVPKMNYLTIDGEGDPNTSTDYKNAVEALFSLSYAIKFKIKKGLNLVDYGVMPLEGLWWTDDMNNFSIGNKDIWKWTAAIMQPEVVTKETVGQCMEEVGKKKKLPALSKASFHSFTDGLSAQVLHVGPYSAEPPTIAKLHHYIEENGYTFNGKHREIYLNDPGRTASDKLKTIIRQPIKTK